MDEITEFTIDVRLRDGDWIVSDSILGCYGIGKVVLHALEDYKDHLLHWQLSIATWEGGLAPHLEEKKAKTAGWFRWIVEEVEEEMRNG